jgi:hypothetical protein
MREQADFYASHPTFGNPAIFEKIRSFPPPIRTGLGFFAVQKNQTTLNSLRFSIQLKDVGKRLFITFQYRAETIKPI